MVDASLMISEPSVSPKHWGRRLAVVGLLIVVIGGLVFVLTRSSSAPKPIVVAAPVVSSPAQTPPQYQDHLDDALTELQQVDK